MVDTSRVRYSKDTFFPPIPIFQILNHHFVRIVAPSTTVVLMLSLQLICVDLSMSALDTVQKLFVLPLFLLGSHMNLLH